VLALEVLAERASRSGKLVGAISSGGLSTRPGRKAYVKVKSPFEEPEKPSALSRQTMPEDGEVVSDADTCLRLECSSHHMTPNTSSDTHLKGLLAGPKPTNQAYKRSSCRYVALKRASLAP
jgi:hypothetical protein